MKAQEPSTPSTTGSRRSSTQLQPLRPTRLFQLGAPSTSNSASASTQSSRHASIIPSPGSVQVVQPCGNCSLPDLREMEQYAERSENHTPVVSTESSRYGFTENTCGATTPLIGPVDRAVHSFHDLRLTNAWEAPSLMPASVERREAERLIKDRDTPKAQTSWSLLPGFQYGNQNTGGAAVAGHSSHGRASRAGTESDAQLSLTTENESVPEMRPIHRNPITHFESPHYTVPITSIDPAISQWPNTGDRDFSTYNRSLYADSQVSQSRLLLLP